MAQFIEMTQLSPTMEEGVLIKWLKEEGDTISPGDVVASVETDKAAMELEAFDEGILLKKMVSPSSRLPIGAPIAILGEKGEDINEIIKKAEEQLKSLQKTESKEDGQKEKTEEKQELSPITETPPPPPAKDQSMTPPPEPASSKEPMIKSSTVSGRIKASPLAKKMASTMGISLEGINGTGPNGRIVKRDVEEASTKSGKMVSSSIPRKDQRVPVSLMRQSIAKRLTESKSTIPHFYLSQKINVTKLIQLRGDMNLGLNEYKEKKEKEGSDPHFPPKLSINDFIVRACAMALQEKREVNAQWMGDSILWKGNIDIGIAVAIEDGLITPIVRNADGKSVFQISSEVKQLAKKAREKKLLPEEYTGGSFTISNLGMYGIDSFNAIINPPEAALLAVGTNQKEAVWNEQEKAFLPQEMMTVTLSCDHRVIDGSKGAEYLNSLAFFLENPSLL